MLEEREQEQPLDQTVTVHFTAGQIVFSSIEEVPRDAYSEESLELEKEEVGEERPPEKIHPVLRTLLDERAADDREQILIQLGDDMTLPRFPEPAMDEPRESETNRAVTQRTEELIREITDRRAQNYQRLTRELSESYESEVLEIYWLVNAMLVELPLSAVHDLAEREDVVSIEPRYTGEEPPQNTNPNDDVDDGRRRISSDPFFNHTGSVYYIGLLDTGVRFTHTQFNNPSHIGFRRDCVNGGTNCDTGPSLNPNDDFWNHGTSSAAIITANANQGDAYRGVTRITLDSWKVYPNTGLDQAAAVRGFENAVTQLNRVIVAEMQGAGDDLSIISQAADNAYQAGAIIIAANGNFGPSAATVRAPANARKVIGVGNFDVQTLTQVESQSRGPTRDGRIKPDIQAPTNTETASNASDTALQTFTGTSGATPYAAGAAALASNFLRSVSSSPIDVGQVYAYLILSGERLSFDNTSGAGPLRLPTTGLVFFGKVSITNGAMIDIALNMGGGFNVLDAALWWPEGTTVHNDVDLYVLNPSGTSITHSISVLSVFEKARVTGAPLAPGNWIVRIHGYRVPGGSQTVYWAAHART